MKILESMCLQNFKMKKASLTEMKDFNVIIGPNNSGKTSLLRAIQLLSTLGREGASIACRSCKQVAERDQILGFRGQLHTDDKYLRRRKVKISYSLNNKFVAEALETETEKFEKHIANQFLRDKLEILKSKGEATQHQIDQLSLTSNGSKELRSAHLYFLAKIGWIEKDI
jgi:AAA15 family ATPase/GTPase